MIQSDKQRKAMFANMNRNQFYGISIGPELGGTIIRDKTAPAVIHGLYRPEVHTKRPAQSDIAAEGDMLLPQRNIVNMHRTLMRSASLKREQDKWSETKEAQKAPQPQLDAMRMRSISSQKSMDSAAKRLAELGYRLEPETGDLYIDTAEVPTTAVDPGVLPALTGRATLAHLRRVIPEKVKPKEIIKPKKPVVVIADEVFED